MMSEKYIIIISGPSGCGKTVIAESLIEKLGNLEMSRSATTRERRNDGKEDEYVYLSVDEFKASIAEGDVLEYTEYGGNFYGTRKSEFERIFGMGKFPILVLDYVGVKTLRESLGYPVYAFYVYTTLEEAEKRLRLRDLSGEPTEKIKSTFARRLKENLNDYSKINEFAERYDAFVENSDLAECVDKICEYIDVLKNGDVPMSREEIRTISATLEKQAE